MKVLLNADIEKLGKVGDQVDVKPGYARNYLFPNNFALEVTKHNLEIMVHRKRKMDKKRELEKLSAEELKTRIETLKIKIEKKAGENDVLFGSVTTLEIEKKLSELGVDIERKKIHLDEPIKKLGEFISRIKLFEDVEAKLKIEVSKEGGEETEAKQEKKPVEKKVVEEVKDKEEIEEEKPEKENPVEKPKKKKIAKKEKEVEKEEIIEEKPEEEPEPEKSE